jgi:hypothetical protein
VRYPFLNIIFEFQRSVLLSFMLRRILSGIGAYLMGLRAGMMGPALACHPIIHRTRGVAQ